MEIGYKGHGFSRRDGDLIVFGKSSGMTEPSQCALNDPSFGDNLELGLDSLRNIDTKTKLFLSISLKRLSITGVSTELLDCSVQTASSFGGIYAGFGVVYVGGMYHDSQKIAHCVRYDVTLVPFRFFPPSKPRFSLA